MHTTPPAPIDMDAVFPQLRTFARTATRLHPRQGSPTAEQSSVGGPMLWPADEPWPVCDGTALDDHPTEPAVPLVPVLQLFADDVPELPFPEGMDVLQVLWCPFDHAPWSAPLPRLWWRRRSTIGPRLSTIPAPHEDAEACYVPQPCVVDPEQVVEYPSHDLPDEVWSQIQDAMRQVEAEHGWDYQTDLAVASGIKVGGYPGWTQPPDWPVCGCGARMDHLLTIASWEFSRGDERRWIAVEDRPAMAGWDFDSPDDHPWWSLQNPTGLMLGDVGGSYVFICTSCQALSYDHRFDCS